RKRLIKLSFFKDMAKVSQMGLRLRPGWMSRSGGAQLQVCRSRLKILRFLLEQVISDADAEFA
ncbi:MAG: hypothetical protein B7Z71_01255, partial [Acidocella sp. 21-58-7]